MMAIFHSLAREGCHEKFGASCTALHNKLQRIEPQTSRALVQHSYRSTVEIQKRLGGVERHDVPGYQTRIVDGNHFGKTEHRLKETRDLVAGPLPGKSLLDRHPPGQVRPAIRRQAFPSRRGGRVSGGPIIMFAAGGQRRILWHHPEPYH